MAQYNNPFTGVPVGWDDGESGWGQPLNTTLLQYAFYHSRNVNAVLELVSAIPETPANGSAYLVQENGRVYFISNGTWYFSTPPEGMKFRLISNGRYYTKTGVSFVIDELLSDVAYSASASDLTSGILNILRTPAFTGDVTKPEGSGTFTLANSGVVANTYGNSSGYSYSVVTVDSKGRITSASTQTIPDVTTSVKGLMLAADKTKLDGIASGAQAGTVTSVALNVPVGLTVTSGSPITTSGTINVGLQSGYSIPTTSNQTNWNTAFTQTRQWDGGNTGLNAATGRTSLALGDASQSTLVSSLVDTTLGRTTTVGWMGLGGSSPPLVSSFGSLLSDISVTCFTGNDASPISDSPVVGNIPAVHTTIRRSSGRGVQLYYATTGDSYRRLQEGASYGSWIKYWDSINLNPVTIDTAQTVTGSKTFTQPLTANLLRTSVNSTNYDVSGVAGSGNNILAGIALHESTAWVNASGINTTTVTFSMSPNRQFQLSAQTDGEIFVRSLHTTTSNSWRKFYTTGNTSANVQTLLASADNSAIRSNISAAKKISVVTVSTSTHNVDAANESAYHRFTFSGSKSVTVRPNSTHVLPTDGSFVFRNANTGNLTIVAGSGVTINAGAGGTLVLEPNMTVTLQKVGTNVYDLIGQTVAA